jgi:hypothetical protein
VGQGVERLIKFEIFDDMHSKGHHQKHRQLKKNELFQIFYIIYLVGLFSENYQNLCLHAGRFLAVYLLPFFEIKRTQSEFF